MTHLLQCSTECDKKVHVNWPLLSFRYAAAQARLAPQTRAQNSHRSLGHHHLHKFFIVDLPITIYIGLADHLIDLFIRELLAKVGHHVPQLRSTDEAVSITIKNLEGLNELLLSVGIFHLARHQGQELWEIDCSVPIGIYLVNHVLELSFGWILAQRAHHRTQLLCRDRAVAVLVEERERLLELRNLFLCQLVSHWSVGTCGRVKK